jgi:hypothetical protein
MIDGFLPGQPYAGNEARTQIDHPSIDSRHVRVWVEHGNSIGEEKVNIYVTIFKCQFLSKPTATPRTVRR